MKKPNFKLIKFPRETEEKATAHPSYREELPSVMVRDVNGNIAFWGQAAELRYGFSEKQAVGCVSHHLLRTIFPYPLSEINSELFSRNVWKGELIHTTHDGSRVKVLSRWELYQDQQDGTIRVREINAGFIPVDPESAQLSVPSLNEPYRTFSLCYRFLKKYAFWLLAPALTVLAVFVMIWLYTHEAHFVVGRP